MSFFDDSHVTDVGLEGSAGRSIGFMDMVRQGYQQQYRVDSALALNNELQNRWMESLNASGIGLAGRPFSPDEDWAYVAMAQYLKGQPMDVDSPLQVLEDSSPEYRLGRIYRMINANEQIKKLNNPNIKSFEQILEEVTQMQHEVEGETASMWERSGAGGVAGSFVGAIGGSFTARDPLNLATIPLGYGRTVAVRIASEMGIAGAVVGATEYLQVAPAREVVGLPERDPLYNIAAAMVGAGVIRGGLEGIGAGVRRLRGERADPEDIDFDLRDSQLAEMFASNSERPSARAGASILDDVNFIERNNPYGEGRAAQERFIAELQSIQRAMNAEPMTAIARAMPPIPFDELKKVADFEIVREQSPQLYARMEAAQARLASLRETETVTIIGPNELRTLEGGDLGKVIETRVNEPLRRGDRVTLYERGEPIEITQPGFKDASGQPRSIARVLGDKDGSSRIEIRSSGMAKSAERRAANAEYQAAYREVEAEAARIREQQTRLETAQQTEASNILAATSRGLPFVGPELRYDNVAALVDRINAFNDTLDEATVAGFAREVSGEEGEALGRETWRMEDGRIDIGLREPVDPDFRVPMEDGEMTVAQAMRDLQDDTDLVEAIKVCSI